MKAWYLLYCKRGQLSRAQTHLEFQQVRCFAPMMELEKVVRGKRRITLEPLFPNYLFVEFDPEITHTTTIQSTRGVSQFVRFGAQAAQVPESVIQALMTQTHLADIHPDTPQSGDPVHITEGVFAGLTAIYAEPEGEVRSILLLNLLNQQIKLSLENSQFIKKS